MSTLLPPPVDENGNISFNRVEGVIIPIREKDSSSNWVDISSSQRFIIISNGVLKKSLESDPNNAEGRRVVLTPDELRIVTSTAPFAVTDEDGLTPIVIWEGLIMERIV